MFEHYIYNNADVYHYSLQFYSVIKYVRYAAKNITSWAIKENVKYLFIMFSF